VNLRHVERCPGCRYLRNGLPNKAPCPECGEPAPPDEWLILFGWSSEANEWRNLAVIGCVMLATALGLYSTAYLARTAMPAFPGTVVLVAGGVTIARSLLWSKRTHEGGDIVWIIRPDGVELRTPLLTRQWTYLDIEQVLFEYGWRRGSVHLCLLQATVGQAKEATIWLNERDVDARAVHQLLRDRLAAARAAESHRTQPAALNPRASPPPGPS
jgi:hypothetical protein